MSTAFQFTTEELVVNVDQSLQLTDLCWPDKAENNIFLRGGQNEEFYLNGKLVVFDWKLDFVIKEEELFAIYQTEIPGLKIKCIVNLIEQNIVSKYYKLEVGNGTEPVKLDIFLKTKPDFMGNYSRDTAVYYPLLKGIVHYESDCYLLTTSMVEPINYACQGPTDNQNNGASVDKNLDLSGNPVSTGKVESNLKYSYTINPNEQIEIPVFIIMGKNIQNLETSYQQLKDHWNELKNEIEQNIVLEDNNSQQSTRFANLSAISKYLVEGSFTAVGGNYAAIDSSYFKKDAVDDYSYYWPRDGALAIMALLQYPETKIEIFDNFFQFNVKCLGSNGYLQHRYRLTDDASLASSWYSYELDGEAILPIQLDQTCLLVVVYYQYLKTGHANIPLFEQKLAKVAEFLLTQISESGLHKACYDLWENDWGVFLSTQAALIAAVKAFKEMKFGVYSQEFWEQKIQSLTAALKQNFISDQNVYFRGYLERKGNLQKLNYLDSSFHWLWQLNVLPVTDPVLENTVKLADTVLNVNGGIIRYPSDNYLRKDRTAPANPWYISTLWQAQYYYKTQQLELGKTYFDFVLKHMEPTYLLPEMADPVTGFALSIKPLIWSHVEVLNLLNYYR